MIITFDGTTLLMEAQTDVEGFQLGEMASRAGRAKAKYEAGYRPGQGPYFRIWVVQRTPADLPHLEPVVLERKRDGRDRSTGLLPCPHCGGPARLVRATSTGRPYVICALQECHDSQDSEEEAIERWNRRAGVPSPAGSGV